MNRFIQELETLTALLDQTPRAEEREAILLSMEEADVTTEELKEAAAELVSRAAVHDRAIAAVALARPESIMFTMMFGVLVGYRAGRQCGE